MPPRNVRDLLRRNVLGKIGAETWGEFLAARWRSVFCRIFGHARPQEVFNGGRGGVICSRCRRMLGTP